MPEKKVFFFPVGKFTNIGKILGKYLYLWILGLNNFRFIIYHSFIVNGTIKPLIRKETFD